MRTLSPIIKALTEAFLPDGWLHDDNEGNAIDIQ